jgi:hypothetical protein
MVLYRLDSSVSGQRPVEGSCEHGNKITVYFILFLVSWGGVRLSPLGTSATVWPHKWLWNSLGAWQGIVSMEITVVRLIF